MNLAKEDSNVESYQDLNTKQISGVSPEQGGWWSDLWIGDYVTSCESRHWHSHRSRTVGNSSSTVLSSLRTYWWDQSSV